MNTPATTAPDKNYIDTMQVDGLHIIRMNRGREEKRADPAHV